jgi:hypothetical protein
MVGAGLAPALAFSSIRLQNRIRQQSQFGDDPVLLYLSALLMNPQMPRIRMTAFVVFYPLLYVPTNSALAITRPFIVASSSSFVVPSGKSNLVLRAKS